MHPSNVVSRPVSKSTHCGRCQRVAAPTAHDAARDPRPGRHKRPPSRGEAGREAGRARRAGPLAARSCHLAQARARQPGRVGRRNAGRLRASLPYATRRFAALHADAIAVCPVSVPDVYLNLQANLPPFSHSPPLSPPFVAPVTGLFTPTTVTLHHPPPDARHGGRRPEPGHAIPRTVSE
ncbi:hypothetical protein T492DRAFT_81446 [Pavlovales sp. CCMP2436]|nr:hypothetical protein T492DRAFT_81446 [Pavlovales sp. CCMP2436]